MAQGGKREVARKRKKQSRSPLQIFVICAVAVAVIFGGICLLRHTMGLDEGTGENQLSAEKNGNASLTVAEEAQEAAVEETLQNTESETVEETETPVSEPVLVTVSAVGDCTLGTDINFDRSTSLPTYAEEYGLDYFLSNVADIFEADDLTIVNFEGTLTTSSSRADKTFAFKGDPSYTQILSGSGVEACNLANNHSHDYGSDSYTDTENYLTQAGLITFGYDSVAVTEINGVQVGLVGIYELAKHEDAEEDLRSCMEAVKEQGAQLIVVTFHWGSEKETVPDETQVYLGHLAVDLGANLVVGHHPHVLQGIEEYNGVNIVYSLGNFCFGGNKNPSDKDTMIYQQTFTVLDGQVQDEQDVEVIPCSLSSASSYNDYRPTVAQGDEAERILEKIQARSEAIG